MSEAAYGATATVPELGAAENQRLHESHVVRSLEIGGYIVHAIRISNAVNVVCGRAHPPGILALHHKTLE